MKSNNERLLLELTKFGLNPFEWDIEELNANIFRIKHVRDACFTFIGKTAKINGEHKWQFISLVSI